MPVQQPNKVEYNDLNGEECLEILHTRFFDWIHTLPELQRRFALTRVKMRIEIALDIWGVDKKKIYHLNAPNGFEILATGDPGELVQQQTSIEIDSLNNPPDLIREEHGLEIPEAQRNAGIGFHETVYRQSDEEPRFKRPPQPRPTIPTSQLPANLPNPNFNGNNASAHDQHIIPHGKRPYAAIVVQDYGSVQSGSRSGAEGPVVGAEKIAEAMSGSDGNHAPVQADFAVGTLEQTGRLTEDRGRTIVTRAIEKGQQVDRTLADNERAAALFRQQEERSKQPPLPKPIVRIPPPKPRGSK